jgi:hypothetical protein
MHIHILMKYFSEVPRASHFPRRTSDTRSVNILKSQLIFLHISVLLFMETTPWTKMFLQKLTGTQNLPTLMKPEGSLPCIRQPSIGPYFQLDESVHPLKPYIFINFNILHWSRPRILSGYFPSGFLTTILTHFQSPVCVLHALIILTELAILTIFGAKLQIRRSSLCNLSVPLKM